jgi:hypothetical protein
MMSGVMKLVRLAGMICLWIVVLASLCVWMISWRFYYIGQITFGDYGVMVDLRQCEVRVFAERGTVTFNSGFESTRAPGGVDVFGVRYEAVVKRNGFVGWKTGQNPSTLFIPGSSWTSVYISGAMIGLFYGATVTLLTLRTAGRLRRRSQSIKAFAAEPLPAKS